MFIPVVIKSKITNRIIETEVSARRLLEYFGEDDLVMDLTECDCAMLPRGETNVVECECYEEWVEWELKIGDEIS